jgi:hypothetical protein
MGKRSEAVKRWRYNCKNRIINAMGGACCICGYNKCQSSLALHHLDPNEKDFGLGTIRASPKNWLAICAELRKCVLICQNCHNEVHEGITFIPDNTPSFDESFVDYRKLEYVEPVVKEKAEPLWSPCPVCSKLKPLHLINCSLECSGKAKRKVDWDKINLEEELKTKSVVALAEELNCSDGAIHKRLKKLGLK